MSSPSPTANQLSLPLQNWRLVTDQVMGGISDGHFSSRHIEGKHCLHLQGNVSTANNGGFVQITHKLNDELRQQAGNYRGIRLTVLGNAETYNLHIKTRNLWFPWQAYRVTFNTTHTWQDIELPFQQFKGYKTSKALDLNKIESIGIVAIGKDYRADVCIADIGFYR